MSAIVVVLGGRSLNADKSRPFLAVLQISRASCSASCLCRARCSSQRITSASRRPPSSTRQRSVYFHYSGATPLLADRPPSSSAVLAPQMVIPIPDIIALQPQKAFRFGHHGLAVVIKGHEELFLDFSSAERRDACKHLVEQQMDTLKKLKAQHGPSQPPSAQQQEAMTLQELDKMGFSSPQRTKTTGGHERRESHSSPGSGYGSDHLPPVMFTSTESTFLDFKPKESMHITCLTIGSRGDVQPCELLSNSLCASE